MMLTDKDGSADDIVAMQAKRWQLRLNSGDMSDTEQREFEHWYYARREHEEEFDRLSILWGELDLVAEEVLADSAEELAPLHARVPVWHRIMQGRTAIAASLMLVGLLLVGGFITTVPQPADSPTQPGDLQYASALGEVRSIPLADGSVIELGSSSRLRIDFDERQRAVYLLAGEAYFDVAKDRTRPFVVKTPSGQARAVGTAFDVRLSLDTVRVTVHEGVVEVAATPTATLAVKALLEAGNQVSYNSLGQLTEVREVDLDLSAAWRRGSMVFDQQPLQDVVAELNRYSRQKIVIADERLALINVSGIFHTGEVAAVLAAVEASLPATQALENGVITLRYRQEQ